jgi:hypothetical protein
MKIAGSGPICQKYGSADPDPYQNFIDPQHWLRALKSPDPYWFAPTEWPLLLRLFLLLFKKNRSSLIGGTIFLQTNLRFLLHSPEIISMKCKRGNNVAYFGIPL